MKVYGSAKYRITKAFKSGDITIALYGLGRMGLSLAGIFADCGARVIGVDINADIVASVNRGNSYIEGEPELRQLIKKNVAAGRLSTSSNIVDTAKKADVMVIVVPTVLDSNHIPDLSNIKSLYKEISKGLDKGDLVIQESTLPPLTTSEIIVPILEESGLKLGEFGVARCPEHAKYGSVIQDIRGSSLKVVGGEDDASTDAAAAIYSVINSKGVITISNSTAAEAVKTFAAVYKDVNIAIANELAMISDELGINVLEVFRAIEKAGMANFFSPGCGVGGHCIPVCGYKIVSAIESKAMLLLLAREINDGMPAFTVELVRRGINGAGIEMKKANVLVMGVTYRGDIKDTLNSPSVLIVQLLNKYSNEVYTFDPMLLDEVEEYGAIMVNDLSEVGKSIYIDAVIVATDHSMFKELDWNEFGSRVRHKIIVDGRNCLDRLQMREEGWTIFGIGT